MSNIPYIGYFLGRFLIRNLIQLSFKHGHEPKLKDPRIPWVFLVKQQSTFSMSNQSKIFFSKLPKTKFDQIQRNSDLKFCVNKINLHPFFRNRLVLNLIFLL